MFTMHMELWGEMPYQTFEGKLVMFIKALRWWKDWLSLPPLKNVVKHVQPVAYAPVNGQADGIMEDIYAPLGRAPCRSGSPELTSLALCAFFNNLLQARNILHRPDVPSRNCYPYFGRSCPWPSSPAKKLSNIIAPPAAANWKSFR